MAETPDKLFPSPYRVERLLGSGGTADVYLARRTGYASPVALKKFRNRSADDLVQCELGISRRVRFPGIVRITDAGTSDDNCQFLQMDYCPGPTLDTFAGKLDEATFLSVLSAITCSLQVLHTAGYLHNDLKASNIFCPEGFADSRFSPRQLYYAKLADMSLSRRLNNSEKGSPTGTVGYMSPEMIGRRQLTPASDIFSLGVLGYHLACGIMPFRSQTDDPLEINAEITEGIRSDMCGRGASFSEPTKTLIRLLLAINPADRPQSAFELLELLSRAGSPYPFRRAIRPRHLLWSATAIDSEVLEQMFGAGSFSEDQSCFIMKNTGGDPAIIKLLLEHNFDRGTFARLDGRWGWQDESDKVIIWPRHLNRFSLRPLRGSAVSFKQSAIALALLENRNFVSIAAEISRNDISSARSRWELIPESRRAALLYSLDKIASPRTKRILSSRLLPHIENVPGSAGIRGKLQLLAGRGAEAVASLLDAATAAAESFDQRTAFNCYDLALQAAQLTGDPVQRGAVLLKRARLEKELGHLPAAEMSYQQVISLLDNTGHDADLAQACKGLGDVYKGKSDYQAGIQALNRAQELYVKLDDQLGLSHTLNNLGNLYWIAGRLDQALDHYLKALGIQRQLDAQQYTASTLNNIGTIYCTQGKMGEARAYFEESLSIQESLGNKGEMARAWNNIGAVSFIQGDMGKAVEAFQQSYRLNNEIGAQTEEILNIENLAETMIQAGRLPDALTYLKKGSALACSLSDGYHICMIDCLTGQLFRRMGFYAEAEKQLNSALGRAQELNHQVLLLTCHIHLGRLHLALNENDIGMKYLDAADQEAANLGDLNAQFHIALVRYQVKPDESVRQQAEALSKRLNTPRDGAICALVLLERPAESGGTENQEQYLQQASRYFSPQVEDIDQSRFWIASASFQAVQKDHSAAIADVGRGLELAEMRGLLPEQWQGAALLSELHFVQGNLELSFRSAKQAIEILKKISGQLGNSERLNRFYNDERIRTLLGRVKALAGVLAKSKGATVGGP